MKPCKILLTAVLVLLLANISATAANDSSGKKQRPFRAKTMVSQEMIEAKLGELAETDPQEAERLEKLRTENPRMFQMEMRRLTWRDGERGNIGQEGMMPERRRGDSPKDDSRMQNRMAAVEAELVSWLKTNDPNKAAELEKLKTDNPRAYMRKVALNMRKYRQIIEAEQNNPALAEVLKKDLTLKEQRNELIGKIKAAADDSEKTALTTELKDVLSQRFDVVVQKKQLRYEELKQHLQELQRDVDSKQKDLEQFKNNRQSLIEEHLEKLLSNSPQFEWD